VQIDAGRVTYNNITVKSMIRIAYGIPDWKLAGEPDRADTLPYDIKGTFPAGAGADQIPDMLKSMLTERFGLVAQYQNRTASVYDLTQLKTGAKLKPAVSEDQWSSDGTMKGGIFRGQFVLHNLTMAGLAELLARQVGRPVLDQTGLSGAFDITLKWSPLETTAPTTTDEGPSISASSSRAQKPPSKCSSLTR